MPSRGLEGSLSFPSWEPSFLGGLLPRAARGAVCVAGDRPARRPRLHPSSASGAGVTDAGAAEGTTNARCPAPDLPLIRRLSSRPGPRGGTSSHLGGEVAGRRLPAWRITSASLRTPNAAIRQFIQQAQGYVSGNPSTISTAQDLDLGNGIWMSLYTRDIGYC